MSHSMEISIDGDGVRPETVDLSDTADILRAIRSAVAAAETKKPKKSKKGKRTTTDNGAHREVIVSLVSIRSGSLTITCDGNPKAKSLFRNWIDAIGRDDPSRLSPSARASATLSPKKQGFVSGTLTFPMATAHTRLSDQTSPCLSHRGSLGVHHWPLKSSASVGKINARLLFG